MEFQLNCRVRLASSNGNTGMVGAWNWVYRRSSVVRSAQSRSGQYHLIARREGTNDGIPPPRAMTDIQRSPP